MKSERTKYLSYIEETKKHHSMLGEVAKLSSSLAIKKNRKNSVAITFLEGEEIIKIDAEGNRIVLGSIEMNRRKVKIGETEKFQKK